MSEPNYSTVTPHPRCEATRTLLRRLTLPEIIITPPPCQADSKTDSDQSTPTPSPSYRAAEQQQQHHHHHHHQRRIQTHIPVPSSRRNARLPPPPPPPPTEPLRARQSLRETWILSEASKTAHLNRTAFAAARRYNATGSDYDFLVWKHAATELEKELDLDKKQEGRRNLFMPEGMKALRTGKGCLPGDAMASFSSTSLSSSGNGSSAGNDQGQGALLGYRMALMERVCAEVTRKDDQQAEADVSLMTSIEKTAVRKVLVARTRLVTANRVNRRST